MDGVITETSENHYLAWKLLASHLGIHIDRKVNESLKGISRMASLDVILGYGNAQNQFSDKEKVRLATMKNQHYVEMINKFSEDNLMEGVKPLLQNLKTSGYAIGIASASHSAKKLTELMGIAPYIDYIVDPGSVKGKPNPDIFIKTAEGLGLEVDQCVGIEDALAGVQAIKRANMFAIGIGDKSILEEADIVYKRPKDINIEEILTLANKNTE